MSRFVDIDLAQMPAIPPTSPEFEAILGERLADLQGRFEAAGLAVDTLGLETEPAAILAQGAAYRELIAYARRDDAIRAVLLATSWGPYLEHLGAAWGVARKTLVPAVDGLDAVMEGDDALRERIRLAPEALTTCGSEGAYQFWALSVPGVKAVSVYGPGSTRTVGGVAGPVMIPAGHPRNATGAPAAFSPPGFNSQVHVVIVAAAGNGLADAALVQQTALAVSADERRDIGAWVTVTAAAITAYSAEIVLRVGPGADRALVEAEARRRIEAYAARQHRPGGIVTRNALAGAAGVHDAQGRPMVEEIGLTLRGAGGATIAGDVDPGPYGAAFMTAMTLASEVILD